MSDNKTLRYEVSKVVEKSNAWEAESEDESEVSFDINSLQAEELEENSRFQRKLDAISYCLKVLIISLIFALAATTLHIVLVGSQSIVQATNYQAEPHGNRISVQDNEAQYQTVAQQRKNEEKQGGPSSKESMNSISEKEEGKVVSRPMIGLGETPDFREELLPNDESTGQGKYFSNFMKEFEERIEQENQWNAKKIRKSEEKTGIVQPENEEKKEIDGEKSATAPNQRSSQSKQFNQMLYQSKFTKFIQEEDSTLVKCGLQEKAVLISDLASVKNKYLKIEEMEPFSELPICVLVIAEKLEVTLRVQESLNYQLYSNFTTVYFLDEETEDFSKEKIVTKSNFSYFAIKEAINLNCQPKSLVFAVSDALDPNALRKVNDLHQSYSSWISYSAENDRFEIHTFYRRIFNLIEINDFDGGERGSFSMKNENKIGLAMFELSQRHKRALPTSEIYPIKENESFFSFSKILCVPFSRNPYQALFSLYQDYRIDVVKQQVSLIKFQENREAHYNGFVAKPQYGITQQKGYEAIEYQELYYLPDNHALAVREFRQYNQLYSIEKYSEKELPFCVTIPSFNNVQNNRYKKNMLSLLIQDYRNYHIVFIDDNSSDQNLPQTQQFVREMGFPKERIVFVKNLQKKNATYNTVHAGQSYCSSDDIQIMLDGDDAYIGRQVLQLFNAVYQRDPNVWVAYTNFVSDKYTYGESQPIKNRLDQKGTGKRAIGHYISHTCSWYAKLLKVIPLMYHQHKNGKWLESMSDDALQYSFYELAGNDRILYIPEITYLYSMDYGDNIYASQARMTQRKKNHREAVSLPRNNRLQTLARDFPPNDEVLRQFEADKGKTFIEVEGF